MIDPVQFISIPVANVRGRTISVRASNLVALGSLLSARLDDHDEASRPIIAIAALEARTLLAWVRLLRVQCVVIVVLLAVLGFGMVFRMPVTVALFNAGVILVCVLGVKRTVGRMSARIAERGGVISIGSRTCLQCQQSLSGIILGAAVVQCTECGAEWSCAEELPTVTT